MYRCRDCRKCFRDNYCIERHKNKKKPCIKIDDKKLIEENINIVGKESLEHIKPEQIANIVLNVYNTNKKSESYNCCFSNIIIEMFHRLIIENPYNRNIIYKTNRSTITKQFTDKGWINSTVYDTVNKITKIRAKQLLSFEDEIYELENIGNKIFKTPEIEDIWNEIKSFKNCGINVEPCKDNDDNLESIKIINLKESKQMYERMRVALISG